MSRHHQRTLEALFAHPLQHEAREALIDHFGPAHCAYRVRIRRYPQPVAAQPLPASAACR